MGHIGASSVENSGVSLQCLKFPLSSRFYTHWQPHWSEASLRTGNNARVPETLKWAFWPEVSTTQFYLWIYLRTCAQPMKQSILPSDIVCGKTGTNWSTGQSCSPALYSLIFKTTTSIWWRPDQEFNAYPSKLTCDVLVNLLRLLDPI